MNRDESTVELDHVVIAVDDLDRASADFERRHGLASAEGGRHLEWGTANRIIPVADAYLELLAVVDPERAQRSPFGRWVANAPAEGREALLGWAVRTPSIDDPAQRLGLVVASGSRRTPDGRLLEWRLAGVPNAMSDPSLPFFIEWGRDTPHPSGAPVTHPAGPIQVAGVEVRGDVGRIEAWLGEHRVPLVIQDGSPALTRLVLSTPDGELILGAGS